jgi:predicted nucleic acid-binding protein
MRFVDSSVFIAGANEGHERFADASAFLAGVRNKGDAMTSGHALAETYAVLTGMPRPYRFSPDDAGAYVAYLASYLEVRTLTARDMARLIADLRTSTVSGGRTYDAVHARTAALAGAKAIITLNHKDFAGLEDGLAVDAP